MTCSNESCSNFWEPSQGTESSTRLVVVVCTYCLGIRMIIGGGLTCNQNVMPFSHCFHSSTTTTSHEYHLPSPPSTPTPTSTNMFNLLVIIKVNSATWYLTSLFLLSMLFGKLPSCMGALALGVGDPAAALVGSTLGSIKLYGAYACSILLICLVVNNNNALYCTQFVSNHPLNYYSHSLTQ